MRKRRLFKSVIPLILCFIMLFSTSSFIYAVENVDVNGDFTIENGVLEYYSGEDKDVVIPDGVTKIAYGAFTNDDWVESITIPNTVTEIDNWAFYFCENLKEINLPDSITEIGEYAFKDCSSLEEIIVPGSVKVLKRNLFDDCISLRSVKLSEGVQTIESGAFFGCENLENIEFSESLEDVCTGALQGTAWLEKNQVLILNGVLVDADNNIQGDFEIPYGVTVIGEGAFGDCENLVNVYIPETVTSIESDAFYGCFNLEKVYVPASVTHIGDNAFVNSLKGDYSYAENFVLCAPTGSYAQLYRYYDVYNTINEMMDYEPTNEEGDVSPYVIPYDFHAEDTRMFTVDISEVVGINETYPIEIINGVNAKYTLPIGLLKNTGDYNSLSLYGTLITNVEELDVAWEWENQEFTKDDFVAQYEVDGYWGLEGMTVSVPLGKEWSGEKIYCYYDGVIDTRDGSIYYDGVNGIVDDDGYLTIMLDDKLRDYIFITKEPEDNKPNNPTAPDIPTEPDTPNTPQEPSNPSTPDSDDAPIVESYTETQVVLDVTEKSVINKSYFEAIVELNTEYDYEIVFHAGDNVCITFDKGTMNMVEGVEDYDFTIMINPDYASSEVPSVIGKNDFVSKVIYNYSGKLPAMATIQIPVGTEYAGKTLYYILLNEDGSFGTTQKVVADNEGYIKVQQDHCSSYVITTRSTDDILEAPSTGGTPNVNETPNIDDTLDTDSAPKTGDDSSSALLVMLLMIGGCACYAGLKKKTMF